MLRSPRESAVEILLVEDSAADVCLTQEAFREGKIATNLSVAGDGVEALAFLRREDRYTQAPKPDLILLDLNMPRMDGRELLEVLKSDPTLKHIPVVILTTSDAEADIINSYQLHANSYVTKPFDLDQFIGVIQSIEQFWLTVVKLPTGLQSEEAAGSAKDGGATPPRMN